MVADYNKQEKNQRTHQKYKQVQLGDQLCAHCIGVGPTLLVLEVCLAEEMVTVSERMRLLPPVHIGAISFFFVFFALFLAVFFAICKKYR